MVSSICGRSADTKPELAVASRRSTYTFVDLFAGLGGFHVGLSRLGHRCVFACEIDKRLQAVYEKNFGIVPAGDIRRIDAQAIPPHEILCSGFPCQPFSLAGKKAGAKCPASGKLIDDVLRIVDWHRPKYVFLENVPNVLTIAGGTFWAHICMSFHALGYILEHRVYSPMQFGVPQQRNRLFIVARHRSQPAIQWPDPPECSVKPLSEFMRAKDGIRQIEAEKRNVIEKWNEVVSFLPELSSHTLIASEFGATYPIEGLFAHRKWRQYRGAFGSPLVDCANRTEAQHRLPHYARDNGGVVPVWMRPYVEYSREVYAKAPKFFDRWKQDLVGLPNSWQKLEWRGDRTKRNLWQQTIQFRASGIRIMRPDMAPSLVAMSPTQTPIIGPRKRYLHVREAAALQALDHLAVFPENNERAFRALGNAVNARIVYEIARAVLP